MSGAVVPIREGDDRKPALPPHNIEAEMALLGAILINSGAYQKAVEAELRAEHFYHSTLGKIFEACGKMIADGKPADPTTLRHVFEHDEEMIAQGGVKYLAQLARNAVTVINVPHYARIIFECYLRREMTGLATDMDAAARDVFGNDIFSQAAELADKLQTIAALKPSASRSFAQAVDGAVERAAKARETKGAAYSVPTGLIDLDQSAGGLPKSDVTVAAGRPGMGKTAFAATVAVNNAVQARPAYIWSGEMDDESLSTRIIAAEAGLEPSRVRKGKLDEMEIDAFAKAAQRVRALPLTIDQGAADAAHLVGRIKALRRQQRCDVAVIDYLGLLKPMERHKNRRDLEIGDSMKALKACAMDIGIPILVLAQLNRGVEGRENKRPGLADLRESGDIEQDAAVVWFLYREEYYARNERNVSVERLADIQGVAEIIVGKDRHGPGETVRLHFNDRLARFGNLART